jgi:DDE superfamily endonuclease
MLVPIMILPLNATNYTRTNRGLGHDRMINRLIQTMGQEALAMLQVFEEMEGNTTTINATVSGNIGLIHHQVDNRRTHVIFPSLTSAKIITEDRVIKNKNKRKRESINRRKIILEDLDDVTIKLSTGFPSIMTMLAFIAIVAEGNPENIENTTYSKLTWLEEWLCFFQIMYGRVSLRWVDLANNFKISERNLRRIFDSKLMMVKQTLEQWPTYVNEKEDKELRKDKWEEFYDGRRLIFWDTANVPLCYKPSSADAQRNTYNAYYAGNVAKGGVFIQPSGWMGTEELFVGGISDTDYLLKTKILEKQQTYLQQTYSGDKLITWMIICDKGFRISTSAIKIGGQIVIQPSFSKGEEKFTDQETLRGALIAADRSGNERAVRLMKLSNFIKHGLLPNESTVRLSDAWICWGFQSNFLYKQIL